MAIISKEIKIAVRVALSAILLVFLSCETVIHSVYNYSQVVLMKFIAFCLYTARVHVLVITQN